MNKQRLFAALEASGWHLFGSLIVAFLAAGLVFGVLYPTPYSHMLGGFELFLLLMAVDVVCGPLLTLVLFNPTKPRLELTLDLGIVACLQLAALAYGLHTVWLARPVYLAYELDRFRVVTFAELEPDDLLKISASISPPGWSSPNLIGVRVAQADDADYLTQLQLSLDGQEAVFRTDRWGPYDAFRAQVLSRSHPLSKLHAKYPESQGLIDVAALKTGIPAARLHWMPVQSRRGTGWTALLDVHNASVVGWVPLDGF